MSSYYLCPINWQQLNANGVPLSGGTVTTYQAGTSTLAATYTDNTGVTPQTNPITLNTRGLPPSPVWLLGGRSMKFVIKDSGGNLLQTFDGITGVNDQTALAASSGSSLVGFDQSQTYPAGTIGAHAKIIVSANDAPYNAKGNGTADDSTAITAAIKAVSAAGGGIVIINPGSNCRITTRVGTDPTNNSDLVNNVTVWGYGATLTLDAALTSTEALILEGDNNAVIGLTVNSTRTINYNSDPTPQRTPYQYGIVIGGKGHLQSPRSLGTTAMFHTRATVYDCAVTNFNAPIQVFRAADVYVERSKVDQFTDTGILIDDCTTNIHVRKNRVTRGSDDHIFCRHYSNSPWATAGNYIGGLWVDGNFLQYTFGKNIGTGGYSDVHIHDNDCLDNWAGGIDIEIDNWVQRDSNDNSGIDISKNRVYRPGRYWATTGMLKSAPIGNNQDCGIHSFYADSAAASVQPRHVKLTSNTIVNPYGGGICMHNCVDLTGRGNLCVSGQYDHGAGAVVSQGPAFNMNGITGLDWQGNPVNTEIALSAGQNAFAGGTFVISNPAGSVVVRDNPILAGTTSWSESPGTAVSWNVHQDFVTYTTDATSHNVMAFQMPAFATMSLKYKLTANKSDGSDRAWAEKGAYYYSIAGGTAVLNSTISTVDVHSNASWANGNTTDGGSFALTTVTGVAATNITWRTNIEMQLTV